MTRTKCEVRAFATGRLKWPERLVVVRALSVIPSCKNVRSTTSSPAAGFFVVPSMTVPLRSAAHAKAPTINAVPRTRKRNSCLKLFAPLERRCSGDQDELFHSCHSGTLPRGRKQRDSDTPTFTIFPDFEREFCLWPHCTHDAI